MALAILIHRGGDNGSQRFEADIGSNRFFRYRIGAEKHRKGGWCRMSGISYVSTLQTSTAPRQRMTDTTFEFTVPARLLNEEQRWIQLISYKNREGQGMAESEIISVPAKKKMPGLWPGPHLSQQKLANL